MMNSDQELLVQRLRRRIAELEHRLNNPGQWASGELIFFKEQIKESKNKISNILNAGILD